MMMSALVTLYVIRGSVLNMSRVVPGRVMKGLIIAAIVHQIGFSLWTMIWGKVPMGFVKVIAGATAIVMEI